MCDLNDAKRFCQAFYQSGNLRELTQAWDHYYRVFKRITVQLKEIDKLDLNYVR